MSRCDGCGGEDCICCEVYLEEQADQRYPSREDIEEYFGYGEEA